MNEQSKYKLEYENTNEVKLVSTQANAMSGKTDETVAFEIAIAYASTVNTRDLSESSKDSDSQLIILQETTQGSDLEGINENDSAMPQV